MPQNVTLISVFIASPSDVREERESLERVVQELNLTAAPSRNARLELIRWETHTRPGIARDPQEVINRQLGDDFDIVVGIFWGRVGTPTPRADSGSLEELYAAVAKWEADNSSIELMIYFKDDGIPPSQLDADQFAKLTEFRESLGAKGILYKSFLAKDFERFLRIDLTQALGARLAQKSIRTAPASSTSASDLSSPIDINEDEGFEDLLYESTADFEQAAGSMSRIGAITEDTVVRIGEHNDELQGPNRRVALDGLASELQAYSQKLNEETGQLGFYQDRALGALARSVLIASEDGVLNEDARALLLPRVLESAETLSKFSTTLRRTREILSSMPRVTRALNIAKRQTVNAIDLLLSKLEAARRMHDSVLATLRHDNSPRQ